MASKLATQLQALRVAGGGGSTSSKPSTRPSLLFHPSQAADIDLITIFTLSQTGLEDLIAMDGRFKPFRKTLFSLESSQLDRELQSKEFNEKLNKSITLFLRLLSGYIMLTSAHQVLEYLIRRHKIQVYNTEDFVLCVLPFHETSLFVRVVQLLEIKSTRWHFLEAVQNTGAAPPRGALVQRCTYDMAVLEAICESAMAVSGLAAKSKTTISFTSVLIVETLAEVRSVSTDLVNRILPLILRSFEKGIAEEYRVGALMIIGALANRTTLAPSLVETLLDYISRAFQKGSESDGASVLQMHVMVMIQLAQTQQIVTFPTKPFKTLLKIRDFIPVLTDLVKTFNTHKFLALLVQALVEHCFQHKNYENALLHAINCLPVGSQVVPSVLRLLEIVFGDGDKEMQEEATKSRDVVKNLLQAVEKRFPEELDKAISLHFQQSNDVQKKNKEEDPVFIFLSEVFHGGLHAPLAETHMSLYLSLDHPQAPIREAAVKQLSKVASTVDPSKGAEMYTVLREAYLRRLSDDDYHVVRAVLTVEDLVKVLPAERLFQALVSIISACRAKLVAGEMSAKGDVKKISKHVMELLASDFLVQHPSYAEQVAFFFFDHLLQRPLTWRLNKLALKAAGVVSFHLFTDLTRVYKDTCLGMEEEGAKSKEMLKRWQATINGNIIKSLVVQLSDDPSTALPSLLRPSLSDDSKILVALILLQYFRQHPAEMNSTLVDASLRWVRDEWANEGLGKNLPVAELSLVDYTMWDDSNATPPEFYNQLEAKFPTAYLELLLRALYKLVACILDNNDVKLEGDGGQEYLNELFVLFAGSSSTRIFAPHIKLLLSRLPTTERFSFLSKFFIAEETAVPALVKVHSLDVLASQLLNVAGLNSQAVDDITYAHLQFVLPPLLVASSSPLKAVRRSASNCVEHLSAVWDKHGLRKERGCEQLDIPVLPAGCFGKIVKVLVDAKATIISSGTYLEELFREKYGPSESSAEDEIAKQRDGDDHNSIVMFFVHHAFNLSVYGQCVLLRVFQGLAYSDELVHAIHGRLVQLVKCRKLAHFKISLDGTSERLTQAEVQLLEVLLQMYTTKVASKSAQAPDGDGDDLLSPFFECLRIEDGSAADPALLRPCLAALKRLTPEFYSALSCPGQDIVFQALISLSTANNETVRSTTREVLSNIKISGSTISWHLQRLLEEGFKNESIKRKRKRRKASYEDKVLIHKRWPTRGRLLSSSTIILEVLVWKPDMEERHVLVAPLLSLLKNIVTGAWNGMESDEEVLPDTTGANRDHPQAEAVLNCQHLILMALENIVRFLTRAENKDMISEADWDVDTVVTSVSNAADGTTRNHALALLTSLGSLLPDAVLKRLIDVLSVVGESTLTQDDSHSHQVVYHMLTAVVPGWLAVEKDPTALLQVFVNALSRIPMHRRMAAVTNLLRVTTEEVGLHVFLFLLLQKASCELRNNSAASEGTTTTKGSNDGILKPLKILELDFAASLCRQYSLDVKLPAMVKLLCIAKVDNDICSTTTSNESSRQSACALQQLATQFVADQLQSSELHSGLQLVESSVTLQVAVSKDSYVGLMEQVLLQLQTLGQTDSLPQNLKRSAQESAVSLLDGLTLVMDSTEYMKGIIFLMKHPDTNIQKKVLQMYTSKMRDVGRSFAIPPSKRKRVGVISSKDLSAQELELRTGMVKDIMGLLSGEGEEASVSTKLAAVEALNESAQRFAEKVPEIFTSSLTGLVKNFPVKNRTLGAAAVRCVATIFAKLGPHALQALPDTVSALFEIADQTLAAAPDIGTNGGSKEGKDSAGQSELVAAILEALESMIDKLGAFLVPYLQRIVALVLLRPQLIGNSSTEIVTKTAAVRTLLPAKIPTRLLLEPLLSTYGSAIQAGEDSTCALFEMLTATITKADRFSVELYHGRIFEFFFTAFGLRQRPLVTLQSISRVETAVVTAAVSLVMKLNETTFRPLFVKVLEWAESETEVEEGSLVSQSVDRNIIFYKLVNHLTVKLRSVFVPYLRYLINGCVHHLTKGLLDCEIVKPKKKKKKQNASEFQKASLNPSEWHLRQLILSALHKCFLYDTVGFLDAPKFQQLLGPIVTQLSVEPPPEVPILKVEGETAEGPSLQEMDDTLVSCLGQMALTAGTDLLWKPLNREVLMCTRTANVRTRMLGLRVVKFLAEHLKEEYLVLLPETIPFLAELLEDTELMVVAKTQELVKILEILSGEDLAQYF